MKNRGFVLMELLVFIIVTGLLMSVLVLSLRTSLNKTPSVHQQWDALQSAQECMEWFLNQRRLSGYSALTCPSTPTAAACSAPSGYTATVTVSCTTWNSDPNYKTITVAITGLTSVTLTAQVGNY